jgi:hypothetical protein
MEAMPLKGTAMRCHNLNYFKMIDAVGLTIAAPWSFSMASPQERDKNRQKGTAGLQYEGG